MRAILIVLCCIAFVSGSVAQEAVPTDQPKQQCSAPPLQGLSPAVPTADASLLAPDASPLAADASFLVTEARMPGSSHDIPVSDACTMAGVPLSDQAFDTRNWRPFDVPTLGVQALLGAAGGASVIYGGLLLDDTRSIAEFLENVVLIVYVGAPLVGVPLGVLLGGHVMGGDGNVFATLAGSVLGTLAGGLIASVADRNAADAIFVTGAIAGPLLGYHLSATSPDERKGGVRLSDFTTRGPMPAPAAAAFPRGRKPGADAATPRADIKLPLLTLRL